MSSIFAKLVQKTNKLIPEYGSILKKIPEKNLLINYPI
jgi:hypothetical protein